MRILLPGNRIRPTKYILHTFVCFRAFTWVFLSSVVSMFDLSLKTFGEISSQQLCYVAVVLYGQLWLTVRETEQSAQPQQRTRQKATWLVSVLVLLSQSNKTQAIKCFNLASFQRSAHTVSFHTSSWVSFCFCLRPSITSLCAWSNRSDRKSGKKLPGAVWLLHMWPSVFDLWFWIGSPAISSGLGGNLIAVGQPGLPPLASGFSSSEATGVKALKHGWFHL